MNANAHTLLKPRALRQGARLGVVSPASTPRPELVARGIDRLHELGYRTTMAPHVLASGPLYLAGEAQRRADDLHAAFADPAIDGIVCSRGGWGSAELLPLLDPDLIRAHPKPLIGYSDITSLQIWLAENTGLLSFYGPMVAADFGRDSGVAVDIWTAALHGTPQALTSADGLRVLRPGVAEGPLYGGCLSILVESLGTPYAPTPRGGVLFLEDIGTKPYQWDRMLLHLRYAGHLSGVSGIVFGNMEQCVEQEEMDLLESAILRALADFKGPIAIGLRCGHVNGANLTLPLGVRVRLNAEDPAAPGLDFLEAAVLV